MPRHLPLLGLVLLAAAGCQSEKERHIAAVEKINGKVFTDSLQPDHYVVSVRIINKPCGDDDLRHLEAFPEMKNLEVCGTQVSDRGLEHLEGLVNLEMLDVSRTRVGDAGLAHLHNLKKLKRLRVEEDDITDEGLEHLKGLPSLALLGLKGTRVTAKGVRELRRSLPDLQVDPPELGAN